MRSFRVPVLGASGEVRMALGRRCRRGVGFLRDGSPGLVFFPMGSVLEEWDSLGGRVKESGGDGGDTDVGGGSSGA